VCLDAITSVQQIVTAAPRNLQFCTHRPNPNHIAKPGQSDLL